MKADEIGLVLDMLRAKGIKRFKGTVTDAACGAETLSLDVEFSDVSAPEPPSTPILADEAIRKDREPEPTDEEMLFWSAPRLPDEDKKDDATAKAT